MPISYSEAERRCCKQNIQNSCKKSKERRLTITSPKPQARLTSPVTIKGTGGAFEGEIGQAFILDHLYTTIGQAKVTGDIGMGSTTYTTKVSYTSSFRGKATLFSFSAYLHVAPEQPRLSSHVWEKGASKL